MAQDVILKEDATLVMESESDSLKLRKPQLVTMLEWKMGSDATNKQKGLLKLHKPILLDLWPGTYSDKGDLPKVRFCREDNKKLQKVQASGVESRLDTTCMQQPFLNKNEFLQTTMTTISPSYRLYVLKWTFHKLRYDEVNKLLLTLCNAVNALDHI